MAVSDDDLASERGVNYTKLRDLLKAGQWKEADYETYLVMLQAIGRKQDDWIRDGDLLSFPCIDLRTIDRLWVKYSNGKFGFSLQTRIYLECGGKLDGQNEGEAWERFGDRIGWRVQGKWIGYDRTTLDCPNPPYVTFDLSAPAGHLPCRYSLMGLVSGISSVVSRLIGCNIQ